MSRNHSRQCKLPAAVSRGMRCKPHTPRAPCKPHTPMAPCKPHTPRELCRPRTPRALCKLQPLQPSSQHRSPGIVEQPADRAEVQPRRGPGSKRRCTEKIKTKLANIDPGCVFPVYGD